MDKKERMKRMQDILEILAKQDWENAECLESYKEVMEYCSRRVTSNEGIAAVIGLDDLTAAWDTAYEGAADDRELHMKMAAGAMIFAVLYGQKTPEELGHYPGIAPAMSAAAEMFFRQEQGEVVPYRDVVREFLENR